MKKVKPGESLSIPAQTFNTFVDSAQDFLNRRQSTSQRPTQSFRQTGIVLVKNNSGADRGRFDVLGIDGPIFTPTDNLDTFKNTIALKGITPTLVSHRGAFVILQEPVADGEIGRAVISGVTPVLINVTVEGHKYAEVRNAQCGTLASVASGSARILWVEGETGEKWAIVNMGMPGIDGFWAKTLDNAEADAPAKNRWKYGWEEVEKTVVGYPATPGTVSNWTTVSGGRSGTTSTDPAYNALENMNNATDEHIEGNGVDPENITALGTFAMMPCTTDNPVWIHLVTFTVGGTTYTEYWFDGYPNGVDGTC